MKAFDVFKKHSANIPQENFIFLFEKKPMIGFYRDVLGRKIEFFFQVSNDENDA